MLQREVPSLSKVPMLLSAIELFYFATVPTSGRYPLTRPTSANTAKTRALIHRLPTMLRRSFMATRSTLRTARCDTSSRLRLDGGLAQLASRSYFLSAWLEQSRCPSSFKQARSSRTTRSIAEGLISACSCRLISVSMKTFHSIARLDFSASLTLPKRRTVRGASRHAARGRGALRAPSRPYRASRHPTALRARATQSRVSPGRGRIARTWPPRMTVTNVR